jgi:hypothetical protein
MTIPTEAIGTIPRPLWLIEALVCKASEDPGLSEPITRIRARVPGTQLAASLVGGIR